MGEIFPETPPVPGFIVDGGKRVDEPEVAATPGQAACEHDWVTVYGPGLSGLQLPLCSLCGHPDWADLDRQLADAHAIAAQEPHAAPDAVHAAAEVLFRDYESQYSAGHLTWRDFADLARKTLEAAATQEPKPAPGDLLSKRLFHLASELENEAANLKAAGAVNYLARVEIAGRIRSALDTDSPWHEDPAPAETEQVRLAREDRNAVRDRMLALAASLEDEAARNDCACEAKTAGDAAKRIRKGLDV